MKTILTVVMATACYVAHAQQLVASAGGLSTGVNTTMTWSIGETLIGSYGTQGKSTVGFHQPLIQVYTSVEKTAEAKVNVYPNPSRGIVNIELAKKTSEETMLTIFDSNGKTILSQNLNEGDTSFEINAEDWAPGVYLINIRGSRTKQIHNMKLIRL